MTYDTAFHRFLHKTYICCGTLTPKFNKKLMKIISNYFSLDISVVSSSKYLLLMLPIKVLSDNFLVSVWKGEGRIMVRTIASRCDL
jgi:hypothetical protein